MAKLKLPEQLNEWKVLSPVSDTKGYPSFNIAKTEFDGTQTAAVLTYAGFEGDDYNSGNVDLVNEEAAFIKSLIKLHGVSNYLDAVVNNQPAKKSISLYIITNDAQPLMKVIGNTRFDNAEIVDFGLQISEILEKLEKSNILHGNLKPENVFINAEGKLLLGGFTAFDSNAEDLSYTAPEMYAGEQPDYTTDIYSLGLMMYAMANAGKLPFENEGLSRSAATEKRFSKVTVPAPSGGNEKLKSVIVIACQPEKKNRWKNAGNIKNALAAIKAELPAQTAPIRKPAAPENTAFESNVFEEFAFDEYNEAPAPVKQEPPVIEEKTAHEIAQGAAVASSAAALASQLGKSDDALNDDKTVLADAHEIDNRVFDDYETQTRVFKINNAKNAGDDNYGDLFEEEPNSEQRASVSGYNDPNASGAYEYYEKDPDEENDDQEPAKKNKGFIIGIVVIIAAVILALAGFGIFAAQNGWLPFGKSDDKKSDETASSSSGSASAAATTPAPTTASSSTTPNTTQESATEEPQTEHNPDEEIIPESVIGYYFDYAQQVLEAQGFNVVIGENVYNDDYPDGYVISMSPDGSEPIKRSSTIELTLSKGSEHKTTESSSSNSDESETQSTTSENDSEEHEN